MDNWQSNEDPPKRNYKWPWLLLAAVVVFVVLAIIWVTFAARRVEQEHDFSAPVQTR